jgi:hypothetical protein
VEDDEMPMPRPEANEQKQSFIARFMADAAMRREYPDKKQRAAVAYSQWRRSRKRDELKKMRRAVHEAGSLANKWRQRWRMRWIEKGEQLPPGDGVFSVTCEICKVEDADDHTFVWGPVLVPEQVDKQGDVISAAEIEEAAHGFLEDSGRPGLLHRVMLGNRDVTIVESGLLRQPYKVSKKDSLPVGTWVLGMNVYNQKIRDLVIAGKLRGYSIGGQGVGSEE